MIYLRKIIINKSLLTIFRKREDDSKWKSIKYLNEDLTVVSHDSGISWIQKRCHYLGFAKFLDVLIKKIWIFKRFHIKICHRIVLNFHYHNLYTGFLRIFPNRYHKVSEFNHEMFFSHSWLLLFVILGFLVSLNRFLLSRLWLVHFLPIRTKKFRS